MRQAVMLGKDNDDDGEVRRERKWKLVRGWLV